MTTKKGSAIVLESAARTATPSAVDINEPNVGISLGSVSNMHVIVDVTAINLTPSVQPVISAKDPASGKYYPMLTGLAPLTAVGTTVYRIGKDIKNFWDFIPSEMRLEFIHADSDSITYSVGLNCEFQV